MPTKKIVYFFIALLVVSTITCSVSALSAVTVSLHGEGVTIDLIYPDIYALVNSSWQEVRRQTLTDYDLPENGKFTSKLGFVLPQEANGALYCYLNVSTNVNNNYLSATLYTTLVSEPTFSEMRVLYDEMLANYTLLQEDYETLFNTYNETLANYTKLLDDYKTLQDEYNQTAAERDTWKGDYEDLSANYSSLNATYLALFSEHNQLTADYNSEVSNYDALYNDFRDRTTELGNLQTVYSALNDTYYSLQTEFNKLQIDSSKLNQTYNNLDTAFTELQKRFTDSESAVGMGNIVMFIFIVVVAALIAFIVYIKRKQENPYLVIRKETVRMKSDEET
jgi:predicted nuclease with TOPRIM domain